MMTAVQWVRSLVFNALMYVAMPVLALVYLPYAIYSRNGAYAAIHAYCAYVIWSARWIVGLKSEIRGQAPTGEVMVAAKHQSFVDIILIAHHSPKPRFIMKSILRFAPILGWFALRIGCVPVDRGKKAKAIEQMRNGVANNPAGPGQLIIYPQGTRVAPGAYLPYKVGPAVLYTQLDQPCIPAATNVGVFWPRRGVMRKPGLAVVEFLDPIAPGLSQKEFTAQLEQVVETRSDALMREAGFTPPERE